MSKLEFSKPREDLVRTEIKVGFKDWPHKLGTIGYWAGRGCEFSYQTPDFFCILTAAELREIADKMDELKPADEKPLADTPETKPASFEEGFDPVLTKPMHYSDIEDEIVIFKTKMGRPYLGTYDPDEKSWYCINSGLKFQTDAIKRWFPLPEGLGRKTDAIERWFPLPHTTKDLGE